MELELFNFILQQQLTKKLETTSNSGSGALASLTTNGADTGISGFLSGMSGVGGSTGGSGGNSEFSLLMNALLMSVLSKQTGGSAAGNTLTAANPGSLGALSSLTPPITGGVYPENAGVQCKPAVTGSVANRSAALTNAVTAQFNVETNPRYTPGKGGYTYCNIYVLDVMNAMGVALPHMLAAQLDTWLGSTEGFEAGWRETDAQTAQMYANAGRPAMTAFGEKGHVQVIVPERGAAGFDASRGVAVSQAGAQNHSYTHQSALDYIRYFVHE
jgi:hypothetical protein